MQIAVDDKGSNTQTHGQKWEEYEEDCHCSHAADVICWWVYLIPAALFPTCVEADNLKNASYKYN